MRISFSLLLLLLFLTFLVSCNLFKRTSKSTSKIKQNTARQVYLDKTDIRTSDKETNIYTIWKDSILYQYQNVKEQVHQKATGTIKSQEKMTTRQVDTVKTSKPSLIWICAGTVIVSIVCFWVYKKVAR